MVGYDVLFLVGNTLMIPDVLLFALWNIEIDIGW